MQVEIRKKKQLLLKKCTNASVEINTVVIENGNTFLKSETVKNYSPENK